MIHTYQIITAFMGSLGFSILFNIKGRKIGYAAFGGMLAWVIYLLGGLWLSGEMMQYFISSIIVTFYSEICARIEKTPATTFLTAAIIPLVPGRALYYTMSYAINGRFGDFAEYGSHTVSIAVAIAAGIMVASSLSRVFFAVRSYEFRHHSM
ncbi:threonine/serine exporter family protein [Desulfosporosinus nitroreducens]|uniref:Threonine/serine exporter family protein n=1 Tax=Desulfosporosinus nitroreducens TaxID=2018668 RepID=A0ABT8QTJ8_9FIRM|nr:threonine/serine exporter family protein [Desulfosporosinus nitroreducens]MCO1603132.1 threonine/serine exporter family protein [Desulfosporosinus nitroreducens]MDO0823904.1 threonine/serine exporter family protein [Desulfosporosinus nitroreducens]